MYARITYKCVCVYVCVCVCVCATVAALLIDAPWLGCVAHRKRKSVLLFFGVSPSSLFLSLPLSRSRVENVTRSFPFLLCHRLLFYPSLPSFFHRPSSVSIPPRVSSLPNPRFSALPSPPLVGPLDLLVPGTGATRSRPVHL